MFEQFWIYRFLISNFSQLARKVCPLEVPIPSCRVRWKQISFEQTNKLNKYEHTEGRQQQTNNGQKHTNGQLTKKLNKYSLLDKKLK